MKIRVTWNGSSTEVHPVLGVLDPGQTVDADVSAELAEALRGDTSGLFTIAPPPARRARGDGE